MICLTTLTSVPQQLRDQLIRWEANSQETAVHSEYCECRPLFRSLQSVSVLGNLRLVPRSTERSSREHKLLDEFHIAGIMRILERSFFWKRVSESGAV